MNTGSTIRILSLAILAVFIAAACGRGYLPLPESSVIDQQNPPDDGTDDLGGENPGDDDDVDPTPTPAPQPPTNPEAALSGAGIYNSPGDVASWPITTRIARLEFRANGIYLEFDKKDGANRWPDYTPPGWDGPIQYTLWLMLKVNGRWSAAGILQYWNGLDAMGDDITLNRQIAINWVYDGRWGPMADYQPSPGEEVGFLVTAGNARGPAVVTSVRERSNAVIVPFPSSVGPVHNF